MKATGVAMNKIAIVAAGLMLAACEPRPEDPPAPVKSNNYSFRATIQGEVDGCTVYYVNPGGGESRFHFVRCKNGDPTTVHWSETRRSGKHSTTKDFSVPTEGK